MRPIISYDDIASDPLPPPPPRDRVDPQPQPPAKKRKTQNQRQGGQGGMRMQPQHWDDPGNQGLQVSYDDTPVARASSSVKNEKSTNVELADEREDYDEEEEEDSRELTHNEIWDDSALIDAWNSAAAEYEAYHGPGKKWKEEPVKKSPLWYNIPPATTSKSKGKSKATVATAQNGAPTGEAYADPQEGYGADSTPINFDTFVPTHDPSLVTAVTAAPVPNMDGMLGSGTGADLASVSQDEAFSRAMAAMYWSGYWTAIYHSRSQAPAPQGGTEDHAAEQQDDGMNEDDDEELLPAQR